MCLHLLLLFSLSCSTLCHQRTSGHKNRYSSRCAIFLSHLKSSFLKVQEGACTTGIHCVKCTEKKTITDHRSGSVFIYRYISIYTHELDFSQPRHWSKSCGARLHRSQFVWATPSISNYIYIGQDNAPTCILFESCVG